MHLDSKSIMCLCMSIFLILYYYGSVFLQLMHVGIATATFFNFESCLCFIVSLRKFDYGQRNLFYEEHSQYHRRVDTTTLVEEMCSRMRKICAVRKCMTVDWGICIVVTYLYQGKKNFA